MAKATRPTDSLGSDQYFAIVPEWVLWAPISAQAVRLYATLARHADKGDGSCHPGRRRLADLMQTSPSTVDRATEELVALRAITVEHRKTAEGDWTSNAYTVLTVPPAGEVSSQAGHPLSSQAGDGLPPMVNEPESLEPETDQLLPDPGGSVVDLDRGFPEFWALYPARGGRKVGKAKAAALWRRMTLEKRRAAYRAAGNYIADLKRSGLSPRDAERFLRDEWWQAYAVPIAATADEPPARPTPLDGIVSASVKQMAENTARVKAEAATLEPAAPPPNLREGMRRV